MSISSNPARPWLLSGLLAGLLAACGTAVPATGTPSVGPAAPDQATLRTAAVAGIRYNGIFIKSSLPTHWITGWTQADFVAEVARQAAQGYAMTDLNAFALPGNQIRYNAIWKKGPSTDRPWVAGWASGDFWPKYNALNAQGYCLDVFNAFSNSAQDDFWYNAVWTRCGLKPSFSPSLEFQWLADDVAAKAARGEHLKHLSSRIQNGRQYYTALYTPQNEYQPWIGGWTQADLAAEAAKLGGQGYQLKELQGTVLSGNQVRFDAVWTRSSSARPARWNYLPTDFHAEASRLAAQGYVPLSISGFVVQN